MSHAEALLFARRIAALKASGTATFAKGGGKSAKGKGKDSKSKKAKGVGTASKGGACCKTDGGKFAPGNNYGSLGGKASSQKAAATRVKQRLAAKSQAAKAEKAVKESAGPTKAGIAGIVGRSKQAAAKGAQVKAAQDKAALKAKQARNAKARAKRAEKKEAAAKDAASTAGRKAASKPAETKAPGRATPERRAKAAAIRAGRSSGKDAFVAEIDRATRFQGSMSETKYRNASGADKIDAERHRLVAVALRRIRSGAKPEVALAQYRKEWDGFATEMNAKVASAPKIRRGPNSGHSVISHKAATQSNREQGETDILRAVGAAKRAQAEAVAKAQPSKPAPSPADRAAALQRMRNKSRVASGKAGAENAKRKRAAAEAGEKTITSPAMRAAAETARTKRGSKSDRSNAAETLANRRKAYQAQRKLDEGLARYENDPFKGRVRADAPLRSVAETKAKLDAARKQAKKAYGATKPAKKAQPASSPSKPITPVAPPPASVERRPITDPVRVKAEASKMDQAFDRAPGARDNFVKVSDLQKTMPHLSRDEFVKVLNAKRDAGELTLNSHEGRHGPLSQADRDAAIHEAGARLVYISRREDDNDADYVPQTVVRSERPRGGERRYGR